MYLTLESAAADRGRRPIVEYVFLGQSVDRGHLRRVQNEWKFWAPLHLSTTVEKCGDPLRRNGMAAAYKSLGFSTLPIFEHGQPST
jgi:hypothetical protein